MYIDAHTHLNCDEFYPHRKDYAQGFIDVGGTGLIVVGVDHERNRRGIQIAKESALLFTNCMIKATVGGHPSLVSYGTLSTPDQITRYMAEITTDLESNKSNIVAIGECGIDAHYPGWGTEHLSLQQEFFRAQAHLATAHGLPLVIHSRDAFYETMEVLQEFPTLPVYMHCWGYGPEEIKIIIERIPQLRVGFCGNYSYPKAVALRESMTVLVHHEKFHKKRCGLLLETDAPWLTIQSKRGTLNRPSYIPELYGFVAQEIDRPLEKLTERVASDFERFYSLAHPY